MASEYNNLNFPDEGRSQHDLIIRLCERSLNTYHLIEKMERHQSEQNSSIKEALLNSRINRILLYIGGAILVSLISLLSTGVL